MFEIQVEDARTWKNCVDAIVNLIEEGTLDVNSDGISLRAMDPSQIAMVSFGIPKAAFLSYKVDSSNKVGINFDNLSKILSRTRGKEKLTMSSEENKLLLEFVSQDKTKRHFKLPLLDLPAGHQKEPKIEYDAVIKINGGQFKEVLRDVALISSHLVLEATDKGFNVTAHGDSADMRTESEKASVLDLSVKSAARATFPLQYLDDITKACADNQPMAIHMKSNAPIKITYPVGDASLVYYLAPRIDVE
ncbi:MAG: proliferating cell nuclear antigen (pcna) [Candidatus Micrarchaeota archaeon]